MTPRLILRPFSATDWDAFSAMLSDPLTVQFMHFARLTEGQRRQWFEECLANTHQPDDGNLHWTIARKDNGTALGWFSIGPSDASDMPGERSFGYLLDRAAWNQGYMTEALDAVLAYEFEVRRTPRLRATCAVANSASARVMEKVGMCREQTVFEADFEGNWAECHHYILSKAEYEVRAEARTRS